MSLLSIMSDQIVNSRRPLPDSYHKHCKRQCTRKGELTCEGYHCAHFCHFSHWFLDKPIKWVAIIIASNMARGPGVKRKCILQLI